MITVVQRGYDVSITAPNFEVRPDLNMQLFLAKEALEKVLFQPATDETINKALSDHFKLIDKRVDEFDNKKIYRDYEFIK